MNELKIPYSKQELFERVKQSDAVAVELFLAAGMRPNAKEEKSYGEPPIVVAAKEGYPHIIRILLEKGADPNARHWSLKAAICHAASAGDIDTVRLLVDKGATIDGSRCEKTILLGAACKNQLELLQLLLDNRADPNAVDNSSSTALQTAARCGSTEAVCLLLDRGADPNVRSGHDEGTALQAAAYHGSVEIVRLLLERGADVNASDKRGETALMNAVQYPELVRILLDSGADVNAADGRGRTALMKAVWTEESLRLLMKYGADLDAKDNDGTTALMCAIEGRQDASWERRKYWVKLVRLLENPETLSQEATTREIPDEAKTSQAPQEQKAKVPKEPRRRKGSYDFGAALEARKEMARLNIPFDKATFLDFAERGDIDMVNLMLDAGISPNVAEHKYSGSETALTHAVDNEDIEMVRLLLDKGADPNIGNSMEYGSDATLLISAVCKKNRQIVQLLLKFGADVDAADSESFTALMYAAIGGDIEIVRLLLEKNPDVNAKQQGNTALGFAYNNSDIARLLKEAGAK
jgi:ankyrin repeat protein